MLVITRREGEEVVIGDPAAPLGIVRVSVIKGDRVRIAFEFPREIAVHRREVADQILRDEESGPGIAGQIRPGESGQTAAPIGAIQVTAITDSTSGTIDRRFFSIPPCSVMPLDGHRTHAPLKRT